MARGDPGARVAAGPSSVAQLASDGRADGEVHACALTECAPRPGLRWLDIGCGRGAMLRMIATDHQPASLHATDVIDWLADDLRDAVTFTIGPAETTLGELPDADRVLLVEVLEHLEAPWTVLRAAARLVAPGGRLVLSTPNVVSLRHRLELLARGQLTSFRPDDTPHLQPVLAHVAARILGEEGLSVQRGYAGTDVVPVTGGRHWPSAVRARRPRLTCTSLVLTARRPKAKLTRSGPPITSPTVMFGSLQTPDTET